MSDPRSIDGSSPLVTLDSERTIQSALFVMAIALAGLACSNASGDPPEGLPSPVRSRLDCASALGSERPCIGLLAECQQRRDAEYMHVMAMTECFGEHLHEMATTEDVYTSTDSRAVQFRVGLSSGCSFNVDIDRRPAWRWLAVGQQPDVEMWHAGGPNEETARCGTAVFDIDWGQYAGFMAWSEP